ncbi:Uncharacterized protein TCAP_02357 [Tolypocladium capitatum]|uniref:Uncharacterized protein n=1 Tax=Tolypocladium capitatum TaxID=45235 RepID=A0A2K3QJK9_9HYPO|nr:Uncharacterized protein TCAP_02357 [Tolypocladium capitatum]
MPIIRLTVDSQGLQCIERLGGGSVESSTPRSDSTAYVVEPAEWFSDVHVEFKLGRARLRVPAKGFYIWDTPHPPPLHQCLVDPAYDPPSSRLTTIQTRTCTGITFFISSTGSLSGIHAHTSIRPSAQETFESLPRRQQNAVMWVYVPIRDEIAAFGISQPRSKAARASVVSQTQHVRLRLGGDVFVGPYHCKQPQRFLLTEQPLALIYEKLEYIPVSFIGIHSACHKAEQISLAPPFHASPPFEKAYFSSAPLGDVASIRIFNDREAQACRGIVIQYVNGSQRALGQCRVGIDRDRIVMGPRRFCFASFTFGRSYSGEQLCAAKVESSTTHHEHDGTDWACNELRGVLRFWFKNRQTKLEVSYMLTINRCCVISTVVAENDWGCHHSLHRACPPRLRAPRVSTSPSIRELTSLHASADEPTESERFCTGRADENIVELVSVVMPFRPMLRQRPAS